jgi:hypothetical protein
MGAASDKSTMSERVIITDKLCDCGHFMSDHENDNGKCTVQYDDGDGYFDDCGCDSFE